MRLFIALNFSDEIKTQISDIIKRVKANSTEGKFVNEEHMHLTLEFLGEIEGSRLNLIKQAMDELDSEPFTLQLTQIGFFKRPEGKIYWLGVERSSTLYTLHKRLHQSLADKGFELENRAYKPHITIGRKVILKDDFNTDELSNMVEKIKIDINKVDLMKSEFTSGKLVHTPVYSRLLS